MADGHLALTCRNRVVVIALKRPPSNALSSQLIQELGLLLNRVEQEDDIRAVVIHGEGRFFCTGADIKGFTQVKDRGSAEQLARQGQQLMNRIECFPKPIIAAIHGAALGGGLELALACHLRLATPEAKLGLPELNLGLMPGFGGTVRLAQSIGQAKALEMILTSQAVSGEEAERIGLINRCVPDERLLEEALQLAQQIAEKSRLSVINSLLSVRYGLAHPLDEALSKEAELFGQLFITPDAKEGVQAFLEKRAPQFTDR